MRGVIGNEPDVEAVVRGGVAGVLMSISCCVGNGVDDGVGSEVGGGGKAVVGRSSTLRFLAVATDLALPITASGTFDQVGTRGSRDQRRQFHPVE